MEENINPDNEDLISGKDLERERDIERSLSWRDRHDHIARVYDQLFASTGKRPSISLVAKETGYHRNTVSDHFKSIIGYESFAKRNANALAEYRKRTPKILNALGDKAELSGDTSATKLWFQIVENWSEKQEIEHSGEVKGNNQPPALIQINVNRKDNNNE